MHSLPLFSFYKQCHGNFLFKNKVNSKGKEGIVQSNGEINKKLAILHLNALIVKSLHNLFHNWVRDQDIVGNNNQLSQGTKDNTVNSYGNPASGEGNNHSKDNEPGESYRIAKGLAENVWRYQY